MQAASKSTERMATEDIAVILVAYHAGGKGLTLVQGLPQQEACCSCALPLTLVCLGVVCHDPGQCSFIHSKASDSKQSICYSQALAGLKP